ncbi:hypothetical protein BCD48_37585 [Pseudofrankia sp. BMG5.36]|nr:hypothetical protein BCD48_37585 [Pseudofrankia sp. BMG5.36]
MTAAEPGPVRPDSGSTGHTSPRGDWTPEVPAARFAQAGWVPEPEAPSWPAELAAADPGAADGLDADTGERGSGPGRPWWSGGSAGAGRPTDPGAPTGPAVPDAQDQVEWAALDPPGDPPSLPDGGAMDGPPFEEAWTPPPVERWWLERLVAAMLVVTLLAASLLCAVVVWRLLNPPPVRVCLSQSAVVYRCGTPGGDGLWGSAALSPGPFTAVVSVAAGSRRASLGPTPPRPAPPALSRAE